MIQGVLAYVAEVADYGIQFRSGELRIAAAQVYSAAIDFCTSIGGIAIFTRSIS